MLIKLLSRIPRSIYIDLFIISYSLLFSLLTNQTGEVLLVILICAISIWQSVYKKRYTFYRIWLFLPIVFLLHIEKLNIYSCIIASVLVFTQWVGSFVRWSLRKIGTIRISSSLNRDYKTVYDFFFISAFPICYFAFVYGVSEIAIMIISFICFFIASLIALIVFLNWYKFHNSEFTDSEIYTALSKCKPEFAVFFSSLRSEIYQLETWKEYFDRIGKNYIVVTQEVINFNALEKVFDCPVLYGRRILDVETIFTSVDIRTAFYVNNAKKNDNCIRLTSVNHVQLLHGESDKASSYNPVSRKFDYLFVAGQAAVERYWNHGVMIPEKNFVITGRPQVEQIHKRDPLKKIERALYAPTWKGDSKEADVSSIHKAVEIVQGLVNEGIEVVFRPHPHSKRNREHRQYVESVYKLLKEDKAKTGRNHIWGDVAENQWTINDCSNYVDLLVGDLSSVVYDFLYSEKPMLLVAINKTLEEFKNEFAITKGSYVIDEELTNYQESIKSALSETESDGKILDERHKTCKFVLGDFDQKNYADGFLKAARNIIDSKKGE